MSSAVAKLTPPVTWAQRSDSVYITIELADVSDSKIDLQADKLVFSGKSEGKEFATELEFFAALNPEDEDSKYAVKPRNVQFHIKKKDVDADWWPRLLKDKLKEKGQVKADWSRYVDEDEEDGGFDTGGMDAMNMGGMGGMGGMPGMGGMGGMPGMGGMGGGMPDMSALGGMGGMGGGMPGGMDLSSLMAGMGGGGGGAPGGMPDMSAMAGMGGMPGMGGGDDSDDSDDEGLPDLEPDDAAAGGAAAGGAEGGDNPDALD